MNLKRAATVVLFLVALSSSALAQAPVAERPAVGPPTVRKGAQEVAGDPERQHFDVVVRQAVEPRLQRVVSWLETRRFPVRVDINDAHELPP